MTTNFYGAIVAWTLCFLVTILVSLVTRCKPEAALAGLIYGLRPRQPKRVRSWITGPSTMAWVVLLLAVLSDIWFW